MKKHNNIPAPPRFTDVQIIVTEGPSATLAEVHWFGFTAIGEARRMLTDEHDSLTGKALAVGRALETLAEDVTRFAIQRSAQTHHQH